MRPKKKKKLGPETQGTGRGQESYGLSHVTDCLADVTVYHNINTVYAVLCINVCVLIIIRATSYPMLTFASPTSARPHAETVNTC